MNTGMATLTSGLGGTARSVFYNAPLYIGSLTAAFLYTDVGGNGADGFTFCLQNDPRGAAALGSTGGGLGYYGITPSVALAFNIYSGNTPGISLRQNGTVTTSYSSTAPVNIASGNPIYVSLIYTGGVLQTTLIESNSAHLFATNFVVDLPGALGGQTAYVGFTGGDGGTPSTQVISNFTFVPLTGISFDRTDPATAVLWWPGVIGGYGVQTRSNLAPALDLWQNSVVPVIPTNGRNQSTIPTSTGPDYYRLVISAEQ